LDQRVASFASAAWTLDGLTRLIGRDSISVWRVKAQVTNSRSQRLVVCWHSWRSVKGPARRKKLMWVLCAVEFGQFSLYFPPSVFDLVPGMIVRYFFLYVRLHFWQDARHAHRIFAVFLVYSPSWFNTPNMAQNPLF
jgi:hypothetical protein